MSQESRLDVFISYRRDSGSETAQLIKHKLDAKGKRVFLDVANLGTGHFDSAPLDRIAEADNFILILSQGYLDRCTDPNDLRKIPGLDLSGNLKGHDVDLCPKAACISPDGRTLFSGDRKGNIIIWDLDKRIPKGYLSDPDINN
jgi:hypothetical protein